MITRCILIINLFVFLAAPAWAQPRNTSRQTDSPINFGITRHLFSSKLSETRYLNIYLPPDYNESDTVKYPVIYLLDGGTDEDFFHIAGLVQFCTFSWVHRMPESIIIGIVNVDRKKDFTFPTVIKSDKERYPTTGGSDVFIAFLEKELLPWVNDHYKINGSRMIIGESLGGLLATEILFKKPYLFNKYVIVSPSLWWDNGSLLHSKTTSLTSLSLPNTSVYIATGKEGLTPRPGNHTMEKDAEMLADKINSIHNSRIHLYTNYLPLEDHATVMHEAVYNAFRKLYENTIATGQHN